MKSYLPSLGTISILFLLFALSCSSSNEVSKNKNGSDTLSTVEVNNPSITLANYLKRVPGVSVFGSGNNAEVNVRGAVSKHGNTAPLFVVDGIRYGRDFGRVQNTVPVDAIESIKVLKGIEASSAYGMEGSAGVIVISTKKN